MHYSSLCSKILIKKGNIWRNRPVHGLLACYKRSYRILFFTIFSSQNGPSRRLNNDRNTSALVQDRGKTPPSNVNPPPLLIWAEGNHILVPESHQTILHPIMPHVSIVSCQFPRLEASQNTCLGSGDHYPGRMIMFLFFFLPSTEVSKFFFNFEVQWALVALMTLTPSVKRTAGLYIIDEVVFTQLP